jgi:glycerate kinase
LVEGWRIVISRTLLITARGFGGVLPAERVASAIAAGIREGGWEADEEPLAGDEDGALASLAAGGRLQARMLASRAVVIAQPRLREDTLARTAAFEIATRARQSGVPAYAIAGENLLDSFDARILDLQTILQARTHRSLRAAGRKLAALA